MQDKTSLLINPPTGVYMIIIQIIWFFVFFMFVLKNKTRLIPAAVSAAVKFWYWGSGRGR